MRTGLLFLGVVLFLVSIDDVRAQNAIVIDGTEYREVGGYWHSFSGGFQGDQIVPDRIVVRVQGGGVPNLASLDQSGRGRGLTLEIAALPGGYYVIRVNEAVRDPFTVASDLAAEASVEFVGFDGLGHLMSAFIPNDPLWDTGGPDGDGQWNLRTIRMAEAWSVSTGDPGVVLAVLDTRADYEHPDLIENLWTNEAEENGTTGVDDDGNGCVDDLHGWDFGDGDTDPQAECPGDNDPGIVENTSHGTASAGVALARSDNGQGLAGVAGGGGPAGGGVSYMPVAHFIATSTAELSVFATSVARGIDYASRTGADVITMSFGFINGVDYPFVASAVTLAETRGTVLVAAAGNIRRDNTSVLCNADFVYTYYPAAYGTVLSVGATLRNDERWVCSSIGGVPPGEPGTGTFVLDVMAPGGRATNVNVPTAVRNIITTDALGTLGTNPQPSPAGDYLDGIASLSYLYGGTSASAPHVAGLAALLRSVNPDLTAPQVRDLIRSTADPAGCDASNLPSVPPVPQSTPYEDLCGQGRIDAYEALKRTLELYGGTLAQDLVIPNGETWDLGAVTLAFAAGTRLIVEGTLNADGTTLTSAESDPDYWWGGVRVGAVGGGRAQGGTASAHFTDSVIEKVRTEAFVSQGAVEVYDADLTLTGTQLSDSYGSMFDGTNVPSAGVYAAGTAATVTVEQLSEIHDHSGDGVLLDEATLTLESESDVFDNGGSGVAAGYGSRAYIHESKIRGNAAYGVLADGYADVTFALPGGGIPSANSTIQGNVLGGLFANGYASIDAGTHAKGACVSACNNRIIQSDEVPTRLDVKATYASVVTAQADWWGRPIDDSDPEAELNLVEQGGSVIEVVPTLTSDPGNGTSARPTSVVLNRAGTEAGRGNPLRALVLEARAEAAEGHYTEAFRLLRDVIRDGEGEMRRLAYTEATRLLRQVQPPGVMAYLADHAANEAEAHRPWALRALTIAHAAADDLPAAGVTATTLAEEYGTSGHARFGWLALVRLHLRGDDLGEAWAALEVAEGLWPEHPAVAEAGRVLALASGEDEEGSGARGTGASTAMAAKAGDAASVEAFGVEVYPNPAQGVATVALSVAEPSEVSVAVYDVLGRAVARLTEGRMEAGPHAFLFDAAALPSGVYVVRAVAGDAVATRRITVLR